MLAEGVAGGVEGIGIGEHLEDVGGDQLTAVSDSRNTDDVNYISDDIALDGGGGKDTDGNSPVGSSISSRSAWRKEVQHIQLQESGYQNKYIWVHQQYCAECEPVSSTV